jgi:hypothetical protein
LFRLVLCVRRLGLLDPQVSATGTGCRFSSCIKILSAARSICARLSLSGPDLRAKPMFLLEFLFAESPVRFSLSCGFLTLGIFFFCTKFLFVFVSCSKWRPAARL